MEIEGALIAEEGEVELGDSFGVGEEVDLDDLPVLDGESRERLRQAQIVSQWVATSCLRRSMVRRRSTVRVRQRASRFLLLSKQVALSLLAASADVGVHDASTGATRQHGHERPVSPRRSVRRLSSRSER
jgi:hypothetical protein